jgi:hypothetical protein
MPSVAREGSPRKAFLDVDQRAAVLFNRTCG